MGKVIVLPETTKNPISLMGMRAGVCCGADTTDDEKNYKRGLDCLISGHGRVMEYVNVEMILEDYSARVIREWHTHIGGAPTRLQASTRYINYNNFKYVIPPTIAQNKDARARYENMMFEISETCKYMEEVCEIKREDAAMLLPLGMATKIVDKRNLRNLVDMSHQRLCNRAYHEFRNMFYDICKALAAISKEWDYIVSEYLVPKCEYLGHCPETKPCNKRNLNPSKKGLGKYGQKFKAKHIFIINGSGGVGKDTFVNLVSKELDEILGKTGTVMNFSSIDKIEKFAIELGYNKEDKIEKDRNFLSKLKNITDEYCDLSFKSMEDKVCQFLKDENSVFLFLHIREPQNISRAVNIFHAETILMLRPDIKLIITNESDKSVYEYKYDYEVMNNGDLMKLRDTAQQFIKTVCE